MFLGIDSSMNNIGLVILDDNGKLIYNENFKPPKGTREKFVSVFININNLIKDFSIKYVAIEGYAYNVKFGRVASLGEINGIIKLSVINNRLPIYEIPPTILKKYILGKGNAKKEMILKEVYKKFKLDFNSDHEADAFILAYMLYEFINQNKLKLSKIKKQCLKRIKKI